jgi:hypothetical protein
MQGTDFLYSFKPDTGHILVHISVPHIVFDDKENVVTMPDDRVYILNYGVVAAAALGINGISGLEFLIEGRTFVFPQDLRGAK